MPRTEAANASISAQLLAHIAAGMSQEADARMVSGLYDGLRAKAGRS